MISIIMPTYNRAGVIGAAIESVLKQTFRDYELIIVDDGSTDETESVVRTFSAHSIRYLKQDCNLGSSHARNVGIREAQGEYLAFLDSDNTYEEDYLWHRWELVKDIKTPFISFGQMSMNQMDGSTHTWPVKPATVLNDREKLLEIMLLEDQIDTNTVMMSRDCAELEEGFDENVTRMDDWEFFFRVIRNPHNSMLYDECISVIHNEMKDSLSSNWDLFWDNRLVIYEKNADLAEKYDCRDKIINSLASVLDFRPQTDELLQMYPNASAVKKRLIEDIFSCTVKRQREEWTKQNEFYDVLVKWLSIRQSGNSLAGYLHQKGIESIAIYGMKELGERLYTELQGSDVEVRYIIDRDGSRRFGQLQPVSPDGILEPVDAILVTAIHYYGEIRRQLEERIDCKILSLYDVVQEYAKQVDGR